MMVRLPFMAAILSPLRAAMSNRSYIENYRYERRCLRRSALQKRSRSFVDDQDHSATPTAHPTATGEVLRSPRARPRAEGSEKHRRCVGRRRTEEDECSRERRTGMPAGAIAQPPP